MKCGSCGINLWWKKHIPVYTFNLFKRGTAALRMNICEGKVLRWSDILWIECQSRAVKCVMPQLRPSITPIQTVTHTHDGTWCMDETPLDVGGDLEKPTPYRPQCLIPWSNLDTAAVDPPTFSNAPKICSCQSPTCAGKVHWWLFSKWVNINLSASASSVLPISCFPRWDL